MIRWFVENKVAANLLMIAIIFGGLFAIIKQITYEVFPSVRPEMIEISTRYPGAAAEQIDQLITVPIQQAIKDIPELSRYHAVSSEGYSRVMLELRKNTDVDKLKDTVKQKVDAVGGLPEQAERPEVVAPVYQARTLQIVLTGDVPESQLTAAVKQLEERFGALPMVQSVRTYGLRKREMRLTVDPYLLEKYDLTLNALSGIIQQRIQNYSLGSIDSQRGRLLLKADNEPDTAQQFGQVIIKSLPTGAVLRVQDIATIEDGFALDEMFVRLDGRQAAFISIYQTDDANILKLSQAARDEVELIKATLPAGMRLLVMNDSSEIFKSRLNTLVNNGIQGGLLVLLVLALLLRLRFAFWVALGIPVTFLGGFMVMPWLDISLNMLTTFGYILVLGIVVDDAIVTAENVFVHYNRHGDQVRAAIEGTEEIAMPVTFGVLTTIAAMLPFFLVTGSMGKLFGFLATVVIVVLLFSLVESKLILPSHLAHINRDRPSPVIDALNRVFGWVSSSFERTVIALYKPLLRFCINNVLATMGFFIGMLIIVIGLVIGGEVPFRFFPNIPGDSIGLNLTMPMGTPIESTMRTVDRIEKAAIDLRDEYADQAVDGYVREILVEVGSEAPESAKIEFQLAPTAARFTEVSNQTLLARWKTLIGVLPGVEKLSFQTEAFVGGGQDVSVYLAGDNVRELKAAGDIIKTRLMAFEGVQQANNSGVDGRVEIELSLTPIAETQGLQLNDIAAQVRAATGGASVKTLLRQGQEVEVVLRYPQASYDSLAELKTLPIATAVGRLPLSSLVTITEAVNSADLAREDGQLVTSVDAKVNKDVAVPNVIQAAIEAEAETLLRNYPSIEVLKGADKVEEMNTNTSIFQGMLLAGLLIYILLAIPFKSYGKPIIVMSIVPFGLAGAVLGHYVYGSSLYMPSLLGMLALLGVLVNDSLVMVDYINKAYSNQTSLKEAVLTAGVRRFRPIFLTTITTVAGVFPLLYETSLQAQFLKPMAISMGFGILFGTFVTLLLVPVNYVIYEHLRPLFSPLVKIVSALLMGAMMVAMLWALGWLTPLMQWLPFSFNQITVPM